MALNFTFNDETATIVSFDPGIKLDALYAKAGISKRGNPEEMAFKAEWQYGRGAEEQWLRLAPGERQQLPMKVVSAFFRFVENRGIPWALIPPNTSPTDEMRIIIEAARKLEGWFRDRGSRSIPAVTSKHDLEGDTREAKARMRYFKEDHPGLWINEEREEAIRNVYGVLEIDLAKALDKQERKAVDLSEENSEAKQAVA